MVWDKYKKSPLKEPKERKKYGKKCEKYPMSNQFRKDGAVSLMRWNGRQILDETLSHESLKNKLYFSLKQNAIIGYYHNHKLV